MTSPTHIFFDFFGTLVDYSKEHIAQDHRGSFGLLVESGMELGYDEFTSQWDATFNQFEHRASKSLDEFSMFDVAETFLAHALPDPPGRALVMAFQHAYLEEWSSQVTPIAGVNEMLDELSSRFRLAVISNTHHEELVTGLIGRFGMAGYFGDVVTSVEYGRRKPCPTIFEHALARAGARTTSTVFVGDSLLPDYKGARAAGLDSLLIDPLGEHDIPDEHRLAHILDVARTVGP